MLVEKLRWLDDTKNMAEELKQSAGEGKNITPFSAKAEYIVSMPASRDRDAAAISLMEKLESLPVSDTFAFYEPDDYTTIVSTLNPDYRKTYEYDLQGYRSHLFGAWAGRCVGCLLGVPVEGWMRDRILGFLKDTGNYPITHYLTSQVDDEIRKKYDVHDADKTTPYDRHKICWINNVKEFPVDDDTNYSICALRVVEQYGIDFTTDNVAETWVYALPAMHLCTAERVAYRNLLHGIMPPHSAKYLNPYREYIGAQIRADFYGYIAPGRPALAASMAYRDAVVSHVKNGVYGAMYIAALISLAACKEDSLWLARTALKQVPPKSRLAHYVSKVCDMFETGTGYAELIDSIHAEFDENDPYDWCYVVPNAMIVTANLLYYGQDYNAAVSNTVTCGFDTDCNCATVGSVIGMIQGKSAIDDKWLRPVEPNVASSVHKYNSMKLDELVERTYRLVSK